MLLAAGRLVTPARVLAPGWLRVDGARVADLGEGPPPGPADLDLGDATVAPGFVDVHVHGGGGASYDGGDLEQSATAVATHLRAGTTTTLASLATDTFPGLLAAVGRLADLADDGLLAGLHLEGPWLSPRYAGIHALELLRTPRLADVDALLEAGRGHVRMVTLAPELPGGLDAVRHLVDAGVVVAVGHTDATYAETRAAIDAGASAGTHLFNAMRPVHHREPGPVAALLEDPAASVELVADGVHLHPAVLRMTARAATSRAVLVTDAMAAAGAADGDYRLGGRLVRVRDAVARLVDGGAIAGSTLTLAAAVRHAVRSAGVPLADAVHAATAAPAALVGLAGAGSLEPGAGADLVVVDDDLEVVRVMRAGAWVER